jgi:pimeloyl-ACP methyl ester carboxylesterase
MLTVDPASTASFFDDDSGLPADEQIEAGIARYFTRTSAAALVWPLPDHGFDTRAHLVKAPVTLIWGADDQIVPPSYATLFGDALANVSARHVVANAGHLVEWDQPSAVAALVKSAIG